jgi:hypothetical protein
MDPLGVKAYLARDWELIACMKDAVWMEIREEGGAEGQLRIMQMLYEHARLIHPDWPEPAVRKEDLLHHEELCSLLARADEKHAA